jgi:hypothetical protein
MTEIPLLRRKTTTNKKAREPWRTFLNANHNFMVKSYIGSLLKKILRIEMHFLGKGI